MSFGPIRGVQYKSRAFFIPNNILYNRKSIKLSPKSRKKKIFKSDSKGKKQRKTQTKKTKIKAKKETSKKFFEESVDSKHHEE